MKYAFRILMLLLLLLFEELTTLREEILAGINFGGRQIIFN